MKVRKRDGRLVDFNEDKIVKAVLAAFKQIDGDITDYAAVKAINIASYIRGYYEDEEETKKAIIPSTQAFMELLHQKIQDILCCIRSLFLDSDQCHLIITLFSARIIAFTSSAASSKKRTAVVHFPLITSFTMRMAKAS